MRTISHAILGLALAAIASPTAIRGQVRTPSSQAQPAAPRQGEHGRRDDWQRVPDIFAALGARPGARIADLGAGEGWLTLRLARQVEPGGRVFASDISERALTSLAQALETSKLGNVELLLAQEDDPGLPYGTLDGVVILNAYHEMTKRVPVLEGVKRALKPGGVLVIVDNAPLDSGLARKEQTNRHTLAIEFARDDLEAQGFEIVSSAPDFIARPMEGITHREWMLVARRAVR
jgi:predicted methyltransferase